MQSWSACHWAGLLLADLDISFNWVGWTQARGRRLYPVLFLASVMVLGTPCVLLFNAGIFYYSLMAYENGIHPDPSTGLPIIKTVSTAAYAYPEYYAPSLAVLTFSVSLQVLVEMSTWVQWFLSRKMFTILHPHIMTIFLVHGLVFWSLGAWIAVALGTMGVPYWAVLLVVAMVCYSVILGMAFMMSPLIEFVTQATMRNLHRWGTEDDVPHLATTSPFDKGILVQEPANCSGTGASKKANEQTADGEHA
jgi:hypothetical protein